MPYVPPSYEELHQATFELEQTFNEFSNRYFPPTYELLRERCGQIEQIYRQHVGRKTNRIWALSPDPLRLEEITCITRLVDSLPKTFPPGSPQRNPAQNIILGALLYRRLSIKASYDDTLGGKVLSYVPSFVRSFFSRENASALYQTIEEVLELKADKALDDLCVSTCCRAYLNYLRERGATRKSAYIRDEPDFYEPLEGIIAHADTKSGVMAEKLKPLVAIQSIAEMLRKTDVEICAGLPVLADLLTLKLKSKANFSRQDMIDFMKTTGLSLRVQSFIAELLPNKMIVNQGNCATFVETMKPRLLRHSQYILLGAYVVVLKESHGFSPDLSMALNLSIGALKPGNVLDDEGRKWALLGLMNYLALPDLSRDFDFKLWPSFYSLNDKVKKQVRELVILDDLAQSISASMLT